MMMASGATVMVMSNTSGPSSSTSCESLSEARTRLLCPNETYIYVVFSSIENVSCFWNERARGKEEEEEKHCYAGQNPQIYKH